jgi:hypothetical protein
VEAEKVKDKLKVRVLKVLVDKLKKRKRAEVGRCCQGKACMDTILDGGDEDALFKVKDCKLHLSNPSSLLQPHQAMSQGL